jgi:Metallo-peptidase family M12B Reprolysin-like/Secretion system C-terminal sorting domain
MNKKILLLVAVLSVSIAFAQNNWKKVSENDLRLYSKMERSSQPSEYHLFQIDFQSLKSQLAQAPLDTSGLTSNVIISFPNADGSLSNYAIYEAPVMEKGLRDKFPDINSYIGKGIDNKRSSVRISTSLFGLHVMKHAPDESSTYIDTYTKDLNHYIVYNKRNIQPSRNFYCGVEDPSEEEIEEKAQQFGRLKINDSKFRTYRMAMACTIEYAAFHVNAAGLGGGTLAQKKAAVLSAMNVTVTRLNSVYEIDFSLRMVLVANNDQIIFITSDNFDNNNTANALLNQSQTEIDNIIGFDNYDIGHTVSTGGGGVAQRPSVCTTGKARGITGSGSPVGDPFDIDYVAHEVGHQFNGNHTQNNNCQRSNNAAREPGSASTIMGYAGICAPNVQNNSDTYFHSFNKQEMNSHIQGNGNCAAFINNNNTAPTINAGLDYTIPFGTPFILKGTATDTQNTLTYCWEQYDNGNSTQPPVNTSTTGPNFRSLTPSSSPNRYMPVFSSVLNNNLIPTWEVIPSVARTMNFRLTVRDNAPITGGQSNFDNMVVTYANTGPFNITSPSVNNTNFVGNSAQTITWNVAGTTGNGINTANVNILYSTNNGATFPHVLAANTPNDGTQSVVIPNVLSSTCRIMIEPVGNIYYALSRNIIVNTLSNEQFNLNNFQLYPNPNQGNFTISFDSNTNNDISVQLHDLRGRKIYQKNFENTGNFNQNIDLESVQSGIYLVSVIDGNTTQVQKIIIE